jgi:Ser/Thr protein kinase RdoA (MazF antagonist)
MLESSDIQTIAHAYDLGDVSTWQHTHKVYRLQAQRGEFALRFYNPGVTRAHIQATQTVRLALAEAGHPIGAPISTAAGTTIVEWNGALGELQAWIPHTEDGRSWASVVAAAAPLRRMHERMAICHVQPVQHDDPWRTPGELAKQLAADAASLRQQAGQAGQTIDHHLERAAAILEILRDGGTLDACPRHLTHGDFQGPNLLFDESALAGIIDFERLEYRPQLYDLAWPLLFWRYFGTTLGDYTDADWRYARACCAAYAAAGPAILGADEWITLPLLMAYIPARGVAAAAEESAPIDEIIAFAKALDFAVWLVQHPDQAVARLTS